MANVFTNPSVVVTLIFQVVLALTLIVVVLFQSGNQEGLSGAIAGGANNFYGKNKGRTIEAKLKKITAVVAVLFLISSVLLGIFIKNASNETATNITIQQDEHADHVEDEPADPTEDEPVDPAEGETTEPVEGEGGATEPDEVGALETEE